MQSASLRKEAKRIRDAWLEFGISEKDCRLTISQHYNTAAKNGQYRLRVPHWKTAFEVIGNFILFLLCSLPWQDPSFSAVCPAPFVTF